MYFIGIDIAKRSHCVGIEDHDGDPLCDAFKINNTADGFTKLLSRLAKLDISADNCIIGMEATGHYWLNSFEFLGAQGFDVVLINPINTSAFRNVTSLRKVKTDVIDAFLIADLMRFGRYSSSKLAEEEIDSLKQLTRYRIALVSECTAQKNKATAVLDRIFPEYDSLFGEKYSEASKALMKHGGSPEEIRATDIRTLSRVLREASFGRLGREKAEQVKQAAASSVGVTLSSKTLSFELRMIVERIDFTQSQIAEIDIEIATLLEQTQGKWLVSIPGIGTTLAAIITGEIGDANRFENPKKLIAYAGMDASVSQSGQFEGTQNHMSKRGSSQLRYALMRAAESVKTHDPYFGDYYDSMKARGKHHYVALSGVARKLTGVILVLMKEQRPYEANPPKRK